MSKLIGVLVYFLNDSQNFNLWHSFHNDWFLSSGQIPIGFYVGLNLNSLIQWQETLAIESNEAHNCLIIKYNYHRMDNT